MISPTLFVGLGTTGLRILEALQRLVIEEYKSKPPIFEYLYFETDADSTPETDPWARNEIAVPQPFPTIDDLGRVRSDYEKGRKPYLRPWIDESLLRHPSNAFKAGAGHIRMAGRLCLWENWSTCLQAITTASARMGAASAHQSTIRFLRDFYDRVGKKVDHNWQFVSNRPSVYVCGTLCGGTCGGMLIDIAYLMRHVFHIAAGGRVPKLQAILTIHDALTALEPRTETERKRSANCWASLMELDYYSHPETAYSVTLPDGRQHSTDEPPFDWISLLSTGGNCAEAVFAGKHGPDIDSLNHMAATLLFTETVADALAAKERVRVNFMGAPQFGMPSDDTESMPCFSSCGVSTVWYPKYRIAEAAACNVAEEVCTEWRGKRDAESEREALDGARSTWQEMLGKAVPLLTRTSKGSIENDIEQEFAKLKNAVRQELGDAIAESSLSLLQRSSDSEVEAWLNARKAGLLEAAYASFRAAVDRELHRLEEGEEYDYTISGELQLTRFEEALREAIEGSVWEEVNSKSSVARGLRFVEGLDRGLMESLAAVPNKYPGPDYSKIRPFEIDKVVEVMDVDVWARITFMAGQAQQQRTQDFVHEIAEYLEAAVERLEDFLDESHRYLTTVLLRVRLFRAGPALENLRRYVGHGVELTEEERIVSRPLLQRVNQLDERLDASARKLRETSAYLTTGIPRPQGTKVIFESSSIEEDVKRVTAKLRHRDVSSMVKRAMTVGEDDDLHVLKTSDFLAQSEEEISSALVREVLVDALDLVKSFSIADKLLDQYEPALVKSIARGSLPHLELGGDLVNVTHPSFMIGDDTAGSPGALDRLKLQIEADEAGDRIVFDTLVRSELLDHFLIFFTEQGLLHMDENLRAKDAFVLAYEREASQTKYTLHTHRNGRAEFDKLIKRRAAQVKDLLWIARELLFFRDRDGNWQRSEAIGTLVKSGDLKLDVLGIERGLLQLSIRGKDGMLNTLAADEDAETELGADEYLAQALTSEVIDALDALGEKGFALLVEEYAVRFRDERAALGVSSDRALKEWNDLQQGLVAAREQLTRTTIEEGRGVANT